MGNQNHKTYHAADWKRIRLQVLKDEPICHWCRKAPSTEADHLLEIDRGGDNSRDNLVGSCRPCNAARGARYVNKKKSNPKAKKGIEVLKPVEDAHPIAYEAPEFLDTEEPRPRAPFASSLSKTADMAQHGLDRTYLELAGRTEPRIVTPIVGSAGTLGLEVARWSERILGKSLMPWQVLVADGLFSQGADGQLLFREGLVSTARQQGKSVLLKAIAGWWATSEPVRRGDPQTVLLMANKLERTRPMFLELGRALEAHFGATSRIGNNSPSITLPDGSQIIMAAARDNFHGASLDCALVDEVWDISPSVLFDALRPSMIARRSPLLAMFSTAGDATSTAMLSIREKALVAIDEGRTSRLYFAEWSLPPGCDPDDRRWWPYANPALGTTIDWEALEAACEGVDRASFLRAHLNLWITSAASWLPIGVWERQTTDLPMPAGGVLAVDSSVDDARYVGLRSAPTPAGVQCQVEFIVDTEAQMWAEVERVMADKDVRLLITPGFELRIPLPLRRRSEITGYRELLKYTLQVKNAILEGNLWHNGSSILAEHVTRAVAVKSQNSVALSSLRSPGPIELTRCMVWAAAQAAARPVSARPAFATSTPATRRPA